ncbi:hypothetical protein [Bradyrhizobium sp. 2TAF24]|uniref:hypothetical protein n=1 Tax=Bradyrhizobium sp. 2TAF24 TaxID=3233011 RepID=UPI003F93BA15
MKLVPFATVVALALAHAALTPARAGEWPPAPFTRTLSNNTPLVFGMSVDDAATALGAPLNYVNGRIGNEVYVAARSGGGFLLRDDKLFLQFRNGRLTGWKGDWGHNWMWQ